MRKGCRYKRQPFLFKAGWEVANGMIIETLTTVLTSSAVMDQVTSLL